MSLIFAYIYWKSRNFWKKIQKQLPKMSLPNLLFLVLWGKDQITLDLGGIVWDSVGIKKGSERTEPFVSKNTVFNHTIITHIIQNDFATSKKL